MSDALVSGGTVASQWSASKGWSLYEDSDELTFNYSTDGSATSTKTVSWTPTVGTWYHVAVSRSGNDLKLFVDGTQQGATQDVTGVTIYNSTSTLTVGATGVPDNYFGGYIDELRISKGTARYTSTFTPETIPYDDYGLFYKGSTGGAQALIPGIASGTFSSIWGQNGSNIYYNTGNVGIGTTNPSYKLDIKSTGVDIARFQGSNSTGCTLSDGGVIACSSDANLKKNISDIGYGLTTLMRLRPVEYNWKSENNSVTKSLGFIAQEVEQIIPKLVTTSSDGLKQLNTIGFVPVAIKAIQEQQIQITGITNNQNKIVEQLTGRLADQNLTVDNKLQLIGESLDELTTKQIEKLKDQIALNGSNIGQNTSEIEKLKEQYAIIQDQYITLSEILSVTEGIYDFKKAVLKSSGIVAGAFSVKVTSEKPQTIGEAYICPAGFKGGSCDVIDASSDGKSVLVKNTAVTATAKIFVTAENDTDGGVWVEKIADNSGFKILIKPETPITEKIKINWWIVEKIVEQN
jgi:hypothetical protein